MNWKKIFTIAALTGFSASVATGQGTAPTIVQGDYISNVFGQSNFIKNPNAKLNTKDVTVSNATVTRSTTTPLVATSEFNITTSTSTGYADWATRTFDAGMKNQNCEARFTYRGFSVGSTTVQIRQGSNTVAQLTLTASTDPRIASINFPCGDLSSATTLRVQQATASLTGTNELSGLYLGLATNQANVAQAELVVRARLTTNQALTNTVSDVIFNTKDLDVYGEFNTSTGVFTAKRAGNYTINTSLQTTYGTWNSGEYFAIEVKKNTNVIASKYDMTEASIGKRGFVSANVSQVSLAVGDTLKVLSAEYASAAYSLDSVVADNYFEISRFPTSSELVVTPERQNTFAGIKGVASGGSNVVTSASWTKLTSASTMTRTVFGKAKVETNNDYSITIENLPVGSYYITASGLFYAQAAVSGATTECFYGIADTATGGAQIGGLQANSTGDATLTNQTIINSTMGGIYTNTSVANKTFFIQALRAGGTGSCNAFNTSDRPLTISVIPLDQPSNSALYVQGPVKAAGTGDAIPAGYVGERKYKIVSSATNWPVAGTGNWGTLDTIVLDAGVWQCTATVTILRNGANFSGPTVNYITTTFSDGNNANPNYSRSYQQTSFELAITNAFDAISTPLRPIVLRSNGSQIIWPDGTARGTTTLYLNSFLYAWTAGTPQYTSVIECVRLN